MAKSMLKTKSTKSLRSFKSVSLKSMIGDDTEKPELFDDLVKAGLSKYSCEFRTVVKKDYRLDDYLKPTKQTQLTRARLMSVIPEIKPFVPFTAQDSDKDSKTVPSDGGKIMTSENDDIIAITAVYDNMNKLCEVLLYKQKLVPRKLMQIIGLVAPNFPHFTKMSINRSCINGYTIHEMSKFLPLTSITEICLDNSPLRESSFAPLLGKPCRITSLSLRRCQISDNVCEEIASKMHYSEPAEETLAALNLSSNHITDEGAKSIGEALRTNRHLRYLNLADNRISDDGADRILDTLIDFPLTSDEIIAKRKNYFEYLRTRQRIYSEYLDRNSKSMVNVLNSKPTKKGKQKKEKSRPEAMDDITLNLLEATQKARETLGPFIHPFYSTNTNLADGHSHCVGNMALCYLNLSYNNLSYLSIKKFRSVLSYQSLCKSFGQTGLLKVVIDGNPGPYSCEELEDIGNMLQKSVIQRCPKTTGSGGRKSRIGTISIL